MLKELFLNKISSSHYRQQVPIWLHKRYLNIFYFITISMFYKFLFFFYFLEIRREMFLFSINLLPCVKHANYLVASSLVNKTYLDAKSFFFLSSRSHMRITEAITYIPALKNGYN